MSWISLSFGQLVRQQESFEVVSLGAEKSLNSFIINISSSPSQEAQVLEPEIPEQYSYEPRIIKRKVWGTFWDRCKVLSLIVLQGRLWEGWKHGCVVTFGWGVMLMRVFWEESQEGITVTSCAPCMTVGCANTVRLWEDWKKICVVVNATGEILQRGWFSSKKSSSASSIWLLGSAEVVGRHLTEVVRWSRIFSLGVRGQNKRQHSCLSSGGRNGDVLTASSCCQDGRRLGPKTCCCRQRGW